MIWLILFLIIVIYFLYYELYAKRQKYPPGPCPIPLLGNADYNIFATHIDEISAKLKKQYGPIVTLWIGETPSIVILDLEIQKNTFKLDSTNGRIWSGTNELMYGGQYGLINATGDLWKEQRRWTMQILRDFGFGKAIMNDKILTQMDRMFGLIDELCGPDPSHPKPFNPKYAIQFCTVNVISDIALGRSFPKGDHEMQEILDAMQEAMEALLSPIGMLAMFLPSLRHIPLFDHFKTDYAVKLGRVFTDAVHKSIDIYSTDEQLKEDASNLTHAYVLEMKKRELAGDLGYFTKPQLTALVSDVFAAGFEDIVTNSRWSVVYLAHFPEEQEKVYREMVELAGPDRRIELSDRANLPYLNAFITEVFRHSMSSPASMPHVTTEEIMIDGHKIPTGTIITILSAAVGQDAAIFDNPKQFRPQRFIDDKEKLEMVKPFSIGKRSCPGEAMARAELFLIIANLVHTYRILAPDPNQPPTLNQNPSRPFAPTDSECIFEKRHHHT